MYEIRGPTNIFRKKGILIRTFITCHSIRNPKYQFFSSSSSSLLENFFQSRQVNFSNFISQFIHLPESFHILFSSSFNKIIWFRCDDSFRWMKKTIYFTFYAKMSDRVNNQSEIISFFFQQQFHLVDASKICSSMK